MQQVSELCILASRVCIAMVLKLGVHLLSPMKLYIADVISNFLSP